MLNHELTERHRGIDEVGIQRGQSSCRRERRSTLRKVRTRGGEAKPNNPPDTTHSFESVTVNPLFTEVVSNKT